jgi:glutamine amidotransferase
MCRLFGFRSVIQSQVHRSLLRADNALGALSVQHPDGWGVAHYVDGAPHLIRSSSTALGDHLFHRVSGVVASETVVAHIRKATVGAKNVLNCHPFQHGRWVFAHNGDIPEFERCRRALMERVHPHLRRYVLGDTDSEVIFLAFLSQLSRFGPLGRRHAIEDVLEALADTVRVVREVADGPDAPSPALLNLLVTDGTAMAACRHGKGLYFSTFKTRCGDRDSCSYFAPECEAVSQTGFVNHLLVASEPLLDESVWIEMGDGECVGVDWRMQIVRRRLDGAPVELDEGARAALDARLVPMPTARDR